MRIKLLLLVFLLPLWTAPAHPQTDREYALQLNLAIQYFNDGNYAEAIKLFEDLYPHNPANQKVYSLLKQSYKKLGQNQKLEQFISGHLQAKPDNFLELVELGEAQLALEKYDAARKNFLRALETAPDRILATRLISSAYVRSGLEEEAVRVYLQARQESKDKLAFARELAEIYESQEKIEQSITEHYNYYTTDPDQSLVVERKVKSWMDQEIQIPAIEKFLRHKTRERPDDFLAFRLLGELHFTQGKFPSTLEDFLGADRALKTEGAQILNLIERFYTQKNWEMAEKGIALIQKEFPQSPHIIYTRFTLAQIYKEQQKYAEAQKVVQTILSGNPPEKEKVAGLFLAGQLGFLNRDYPSGISHYRSLLSYRSFPQVAQEARIGIGDCFLASGAHDSALYQYRQLLVESLNQEVKERVLFNLGEAFLFAEEFDSASYYYDQLIQLSLRSPLANDALERRKVVIENITRNPSGLAVFARAKKSVYQSDIPKALELAQELKSQKGLLAEVAYLEESRIYSGLKEWEKSLATLENLTAEFPQSYFTPLAIKLSADLNLEKLGKPEIALELYQKVLRDYPQALFLDQVRQKIKELGNLQKPSS